MEVTEKITELKERYQEKVDALKAMLEKVDSEERDFSEEEVTEYDNLEAEKDKIKHDLERMEKVAADEAELEARREKPYVAKWSKPTKPSEDFASIGEFFRSIYETRFLNRQDPRLDYREFETRATDQSMGSGVMGGFAIPEQFKGDLLSVSPQEAIFRPRATVIPAGDPPDAKISMPALDQTSAENMYGGVVVAPVDEGGTKNVTDMRLKQVSLEPNEVAGYIVATDKLLRNWTSAGALLGNQLRKAITGWEDDQFLTGNGVGRPQGILNTPCRIRYTRATASQISFADVSGMYARMKFGGSLVWIASQTTLPQLMTIQDAGSNYIYVMNAANEVPNTLFGIPVLFNDRSPALGSEGDLVLADLNYYLIKDGSGPYVDMSEHVYFTSNRTVIKAFWNVDGKGWLSEPIPLEGSTSNTVSPFVVLK